MHWSYHTVTLEAFGFAAVGIVTGFLIAYAIAGRRTVREWNRVGPLVPLCGDRHSDGCHARPERGGSRSEVK
jgi:hypothetical protein